MTEGEPTFVVWRHADGDVKAVGHFVERDVANEYTRYLNRTNPARWHEVRRNDEGANRL